MQKLRWISALVPLLAACQGPSSESAALAGPTDDEPVEAAGSTRERTDIAFKSAERPVLQEQEQSPADVGAAGFGSASDVGERQDPAQGDDDLLGAELADSAWQTFRDNATQVAEDGTIYYLVEWDLSIHSEADLRAYYDSRIAGDVDKGVVFLVPGSNVDDVWEGLDRLHLRYCVDTNATTGFDAPGSQVSSATMIAAMDEAARAWERVANVRIEYDPSRNNNCSLTSAVPDTTSFKVARSDTLATVFAFTPSGQTAPGLDGRTIGVPSQYINSLAPPGFTWPGTMMHELGHVLGFAHEHFHTNGGQCASPSPARDVTDEVDLFSIMGYPSGSPGTPACAQTTPNLTALSYYDGWTARSFYGPPPAWHVVLSRPLVLD